MLNVVIWSAPHGPFIHSDQIQTAAERSLLEQMRSFTSEH